MKKLARTTLGCWFAIKMVDSSLKWCLVNCASIILKFGASYRYLPIYSTLPILGSGNPGTLE